MSVETPMSMPQAPQPTGPGTPSTLPVTAPALSSPSSAMMTQSPAPSHAGASPMVNAYSGATNAASPAGSTASLPMSARPQPEAGPSRSPRVQQAMSLGSGAGMGVGVGSPLANGGGSLPAGSPRMVNGAGAGREVNGAASGSPAVSAVSAGSGTAGAAINGDGTNAGLRNVLSGNWGPGQEAIMKQLEALSHSKMAREKHLQTTPRTPNQALPVSLSTPIPPPPASLSPAGSMLPPVSASSASDPAAAVTPTAASTGINGSSPSPNAVAPAQAPSAGTGIAAPSPGQSTSAGTPAPSAPAVALPGAGPSAGSSPSPAVASISATASPAAAASPAFLSSLPVVPKLPNGQIDTRQLQAFANALTPEQKQAYMQNRQRLASQASRAGIPSGSPSQAPAAVTDASATQPSSAVDQAGTSSKMIDSPSVPGPANGDAVPQEGAADGAQSKMAAQEPAAPTATAVDAPPKASSAADGASNSMILDQTSIPASAPARASVEIPSSSSAPELLVPASASAAASTPTSAPSGTARPPSAARSATPTTASTAGSAAQARPPASGQPQPAWSAQTAGAVLPAMRGNKSFEDQRSQFLATYLSYHRSKRIMPHPDIMETPPIGTVSIGDTGLSFDLMELFLYIMRSGKMFEEAVKENSSPPVIHQFAASKSIPNPLPKLVKLPQPVGSPDPPTETTDAVEYIVEAFKVYLGGYNAHMAAMRHAALMQKHLRLAAAAASPSSPAGGQPGAVSGAGQSPQQQQASQVPATGVAPPTQEANTPTQGTPALASQQTPQPGGLPSSGPQQPQQQISTPAQMQGPMSNQPRPPMQQQMQPTGVPNMRPPHSINGTAPSPVNVPGSMPNFAQPGSMPGQPPMNLSVNGLPSHVQDAQSHSATPSPPTTVSARGRPPKAKAVRPPPINTDGAQASQSMPQQFQGMPMQSVQTPSTMQPSQDGLSTPGMALNPAKLASKKRKKAGEPPTPSSSTHVPLPSQASMQPPAPKRPRWKVEYAPLRVPAHNLAGWDERAVASTFPKYNMGQSRNNRSIHELQIVDMESILMGLRSRMPKELGYSITVLSMLSLTYPEDNFGGLPVAHIPEILEELLELLAEKALGDDGLDGWKSRAKERASDDNKQQVLFSELHRLGRDRDFSFEASEFRPTPDIVLSLVNLLRNFALFPDNHKVLADNTDLLQLLVAVSDPRLCNAFGGSLYSVVELARIQRDVIVIYANIGYLVDLRKLEWAVVKSFYRLLASFLVPAWEVIQSASHPPGRPPLVLSIHHAMEAFAKIAAVDTNREVLARLPGSEVVELYGALVKLLPVTPMQYGVTTQHEEILCFVEFVAHALYSLAFLATPSSRTEMRKVPGAIDVISRIVLDSAPLRPHPHAPPQMPGGPPAPLAPGPLAVLGRRLVEMLGVLNGTWSPGGGVSGPTGMGFGAGGIEGKGWTFKSQSVEPGWLAAKEEEITGVLFQHVDPVVWQELDGLVWGQ